MLKPRKLVALRKKKPRIREFSSDADETIKDFNQATDKLDTSAIVGSWFEEFAEETREGELKRRKKREAAARRAAERDSKEAREELSFSRS